MRSHYFVQLKKEQGVALITVIIFFLLISMVALTSIFLMTNQSRLAEKQVRRIRAMYSSQAGIVQAYDELLNSPNNPPTLTTPSINLNSQTTNITYSPPPPAGTGAVGTVVNFSLPLP